MSDQEELFPERIDAGPFPDALFFSSSGKAIEHIVNHLLTKPEGEAWRQICDDEGAALLTLGDSQRLRLSKALLRAPAQAQPLYALYRTHCQVGLADASRLDWLWDERPQQGNVRCVKAFGLTGVLCIMDVQAVRSVQLPGLGTARLASQSTPTVFNPIPRQRSASREETFAGMGGRRRHFIAARKKREEKDAWFEKKGRKNGLSEQEHERWRIFHNCAKAVRNELLGAYRLGRTMRKGPPSLLRQAMRDPLQWDNLRRRQN